MIQQSPTEERSDGTRFGEVQCHCSEDDGVPDVGVSLGLGCGKALWIGELLTRDGATCGMVMHDGTKRIVAPFADGTDWQEAADILRHHVAPALALASQAAQPAEADDWVMVPRQLTEEMARAGAKGRQNSARASFEDGWKLALAATPKAPATDASRHPDLRACR